MRSPAEFKLSRETLAALKHELSEYWVENAANTPERMAKLLEHPILLHQEKAIATFWEELINFRRYSNTQDFRHGALTDEAWKAILSAPDLPGIYAYLDRRDPRLRTVTQQNDQAFKNLRFSSFWSIKVQGPDGTIPLTPEDANHQNPI